MAGPDLSGLSIEGLAPDLSDLALQVPTPGADEPQPDPLEFPGLFSPGTGAEPGPFMDPGFKLDLTSIAEPQVDLGKEADRFTSRDLKLRLDRAMLKAFTDPFKADDPIGIDPGGGFEKVLRDIGLFRSLEGPIGLRSTITTFNEVIIRPGAQALDIVARTVQGGLQAAGVAIGKLARELGIAEGAMVDRLVRDTVGMLLAGIIVMGGGPVRGGPRVSLERSLTAVEKRAAATAVLEGINKQVNTILERSPPGTKVRIKEEVARRLQSVLDLAEVESAAAKVGKLAEADQIPRQLFGHGGRVLTATLNRFAPVKILAKKGARAEAAVTGKTLTADELLLAQMPYDLMRLTTRNFEATEAIARFGAARLARDGSLEFTGKAGYMEAIAPAAGNLAKFMLHRAGKRAADLTKRGIEHPFTPAEVQAMIRLDRQFPEFPGTLKNMREFNESILDLAVQGGRISAADKARMLDAGQNFIPFHRLFEDLKGIPVRFQGSPFKRIRGDKKRPLNDLLENEINNFSMIINETLKNQAKVAVIDMLERFGLVGQEGVVMRLKTIPAEVLLADKRAAVALENIGLAKPGGLVRAFTPERVSEGIEVIYRAGKREFYRIEDPTLYKSFIAMRPISQRFPPAVLKPLRLMALPSRLLRRMVTLSPEFFLLRNPIRDLESSIALTQGNLLPGIGQVRGLASRILEDDLYKRYLLNRGMFAINAAEARVFRRDLEGRRLKAGLSTKAGDVILDSPRAVASFLDKLSSAPELMTRLEEFRLVEKRTGSTITGVGAAADVTADFSLVGANPIIQAAAMQLPFVNPRAQGILRLAEVGKATPLRLMTRGIVAITIPTLALYAFNRTDPRYQAEPEFVKDTYDIIYLDKLGFDSEGRVLIPRGFEPGALFGTIPMRLAEAAEAREGRRFANAFLRIFVDAVGVNLIPQAARPIAETGLPVGNFFGFNRKFTGAPVVPESLKGKVMAGQEFRFYTSDTMKLIARQMKEETGVEISPMRLENLFRGYMGILGMNFLAGADYLVDLQTKGKRPSPRLDSIAIVRAIFKDAPMQNTAFMQAFYDLNAATIQLLGTISKATREGQAVNPLEDLSVRDQRVLALSKAVAGVAEAASVIRKDIEFVANDASLSPNEKRKQIDQLQELRVNLFREFAGAVPEDVKRRFLFPVTPKGGR